MEISKSQFERYKQEYETNGWTKVEGVFSPAEVDQIIEHLKIFVQVNKNKFEPREINYVGDLVNSVHCLRKYEDPFFKGIQDNEKISELMTYLLNDKPECRGGEAFLKPAAKGLPSPMHQDDFYWCVSDHNALTCWIALDDVSAENGGVSYYSRSHDRGLIPHISSFAPGSSQKIPPEALMGLGQPVCPPLKKGDMLIHHSLTIHGSEANVSGKSRRGMTIQYKGQTSTYDLQRKQAYEKNLQEQINSRQSPN